MQFPKVRRSQIDVERILDELVIYDRKSHRSHCLNKTAASVWELADGTRSIDEIAQELSCRGSVVADSDVVEFCLADFADHDLIETAWEKPRKSISRRALIARLGSAALVPAILSIGVPTPAFAQTVIIGTGPTGPTGPTGATGATGPTGPTGFSH